jgi:hypothetical protein
MMYTRGARSIAREGMQIIQFESKMAKGRIEICKPVHALVSMTLTAALDRLLEELPRAEIDYIHGDEEFHELAKEHANLGFLMEPMTKDQIFSTVIHYGVLPKKAFSIGQAVEKRYYLECRLLVHLKPAAAEPEPLPEGAPEAAEAQAQASAEPMQSVITAQPYEAPAEDGGEEAPAPSHKGFKGLFGRRKDK